MSALDNSLEPEMEGTVKKESNFSGFVRQKKCTDICMLIVFLIFLCGMIGLFIYGLANSNVSFLYLPTDHRGQLCDYDNNLIRDSLEIHRENLRGEPVLLDLSGKPYLFWVRPGKINHALSFCVEKCPSEGVLDTYVQAMLNENYFPNGIKNPKEPSIENYTAAALGETPGNFYTYKTQVLARRCIPTEEAFGLSFKTNNFSNVIADLTDSFSSMNIIVTVVGDLANTWKFILLATGIGLILSIIWLLLLRFLAGIFVWATVLLCLGALGSLTYFCYVQKNDLKGLAKVAEVYTMGFYSQDLNRKVFGVIYWIVIVLDIIFVLLILVFCERIQLSVAIVKVVSQIYGKVWTIFFFPLILCLILFIWWAYVIAVAIVLFGAGYPVYEFNNELNVEKISYQYDRTIEYLSIYHFVGFLWVSNFLSAFGQMVISGVVADYYFTKKPRSKNLADSIVWGSFKQTLFYHTGSLAFGSLIITIIQIIRLILEYIDQKTKGTENTFVKFLLKCFKCYFWCLEKVFKFINRNGYAMMAIHGDNFFTSCRKAFELILRNCVRVAILNWTGDFTLFLGKIFVSSLTTGISLYFFSQDETITFILIPGIIIFILSFIVSGAFTNLFEIGIDSVFLCFMEDEEQNDGSPGHERYAPKAIRSHLSAAH